MFGPGNRAWGDRGGDRSGGGARTDAGSPGKQTLTGVLSGGLPGGQPQQAQPTQTAEQAQAAATDAYYTEVSAVIQQILRDYQRINVNAPTTPPPAPEPAAATTAESTAAATAEPTAAATAEPTAEATEAPPAASPMVPVVVSTPYWNNKYPDHDEDGGNDPINNPVPPVDYSNVARQAAFDAYDAAARADATVADPPANGTESTAVAVAKGSPEDIEGFVQNAIGFRLIPQPAPPPGTTADDAWWTEAWRAAIQQWMVEVGIGVDCNGLVFQAMLRVRAAVPEGRTTADQGTESVNGVTDYYSASYATTVSTEAFGGDDIDRDPARTVTLGEDIPTALQLQPGDVMYLSHSHVRIIMSVELRTAEAIEFTTAESTTDGRTAEGLTYEGPRRHQWRWDGQLWQRYEGARRGDPWLEANESPSYRRHLLPPA